MKLKYYLRGMGIGIILTAIVMGFALGGRSKTMSDAEVIQRAKALGMVEGEPNVLSGTPTIESESESEGDTNDASASDETLDEEGEEISEEDEQGESLSDTSISEVAEEESEAEEEDQSGSSTSVEASAETKNKPSVINAAGSETDVVTTGTASSTEDTDSSKTADSSKTTSGSSSQESTAASETSTQGSTAASGTSTQESSAASGASAQDGAARYVLPRRPDLRRRLLQLSHGGPDHASAHGQVQDLTCEACVPDRQHSCTDMHHRARQLLGGSGQFEHRRIRLRTQHDAGVHRMHPLQLLCPLHHRDGHHDMLARVRLRPHEET